jgi:predicted PhzF superfamily epimerase YddE/YHI9
MRTLTPFTFSRRTAAQSDENVIIEQGLEILRPGTMKVRAKWTAEGVRDVRVSGSAVCVGTGQIEFAS